MIDWLDTAIVVAFIGLGGSAFFAIVGYIFKNKREAKRSARRVLYILLEIRHSLKAVLFDSEKAASDYIVRYKEVLKRKGVSEEEIPDTTEMESMVAQHFRNINMTNKSDIEGTLLDIYENALSELACDSPVLAYKLKGKEKFEAIAAQTSSYLDAASNELYGDKKDQNAEKVITHINSFAHNEANSKLTGMLDDDLRMLAKYCGWKERFQVWFLLRQGNAMEEFFDELDYFFDQVFNEIHVKASDLSSTKNEINKN